MSISVFLPELRMQLELTDKGWVGLVADSALYFRQAQTYSSSALQGLLILQLLHHVL